MTQDWQNGGFGIYVHWPFCQAKCPYCDFNSHVSNFIDQNQWLNAYILELEQGAMKTGSRVVNTIFFGGGTPSLMKPHLIHEIISKIKSLWHISNDCEITLEANPTSVEAGHFRGYAQAGVNRISMGIQALNDKDLKALGRLHNVSDAFDAFDVARNNFDRVSFDLIYARQHQTLKDWKLELNNALSLATDHLSLYQLTIEQGTAFGDRYNIGKLKGLPDENTAADMYEVTQEICDSVGLNAYEISNHAKAGCESRHNLIYWRYGDYLGIGPGAHGRLTLDNQRYATETELNPKSWLDNVLKGAQGTKFSLIKPYDQGIEYLLMGMRITQGISKSRYSTISNLQIQKSKIEKLLDIGMIIEENDNIRATAKGRAVLNSVITELIGD